MNVNKPLLRRSSLSLSSAVQPFRKNKLAMTNSHGGAESSGVGANGTDGGNDVTDSTAFDELRAYVKQVYLKQISWTLMDLL